jgi:hypothetical protein
LTKVAPDNAIPVRILICAFHFVVGARSNRREKPDSIVSFTETLHAILRSAGKQINQTPLIGE